MKYLLLTFLVIFSAKGFAVKNKLKFSLGSYLGEPMVFQSGNFNMAGFYIDLATRIGQEMNVDVSFVEIPRQRLYSFLRRNQYTNISCFTNPLWTQIGDNLSWSRPYLASKSVFASLGSNNYSINHLQNPGMRIGVIRGYRYEGFLREGFLAKKLIRVDAENSVESIGKLLKGEVDALVHHDLELTYHLKKMNLKNKVKVHQTPYKTYDIYCAFSPQSFITKVELDRALKKMTDEGFIRSRLNTYYESANQCD